MFNGQNKVTMKKTIVLLCLAVFNLSVFSQNNDANYKIGVRQISLDVNRAFLDLGDSEFKQIKGSPYDSDVFLLGSIFQNEQLVEKNAFLRYNIFSNEIEIKKSSSDTEYNALIRNSDMIIKIEDDVFVLIPFEGEDEKGSYFKIISSGAHLDLYKRSSVEYTPRTFPKTSYDREKPAKFMRTDSYYLMLKDGKFVEMPKKKSKLLKIMKRNENEIKDFIKVNHINLKEENDLIKLVKFYNSLL